MDLLLTVLVTFFAGMGAGLGTGFAGMSAAAVISGDTTAHTKPHPAPLLEAARRMGIAANRCLYVGDDKRDMDAAKAAGMPCIAALWGYLGEHAVASWGADAQAQHPHEILHLLATQQANT